MEIQELDKKQLILLTLLITFVVSIATGIITVSLMNQMPKSIPQTINNVIQRTIEKVTTVETPTKTDITTSQNNNSGLNLSGDVLVSIYPSDAVSFKGVNAGTTSSNITTDTSSTSPVATTTLDQSNSVITSTDTTKNSTTTPYKDGSLGQGIIISDIGLVLVDTSILTDSTTYKIVLDKIDFDATVLKKFGNGFTILKIEKKTPSKIPAETKNIDGTTKASI